MTEFRDAEYITTIDGTKQIRVKIDGVESWVMMDTANRHYREICKGKIDDQQVIKERASPTSVFKHLHHLKDRGWIERHTLPRGIKII